VVAAPEPLVHALGDFVGQGAPFCRAFVVAEERLGVSHAAQQATMQAVGTRKGAPAMPVLTG
jgi:hypothetical protein